jgi:hypothetical protein
MMVQDLGWIQIANFIVTGLLVIIGALGLRRVAQADKRLRRGALLLGIFGLGLAAVCLTDPGFSPTRIPTRRP